jgi:hypothetical protein
MIETITPKTIIKMKEIIDTFREHYREDRKDFWEVIIGSILITSFIVFMFWFVGTFCYDM